MSYIEPLVFIGGTLIGYFLRPLFDLYILRKESAENKKLADYNRVKNIRDEFIQAANAFLGNSDDPDKHLDVLSKLDFLLQEVDNDDFYEEIRELQRTTTKIHMRAVDSEDHWEISEMKMKRTTWETQYQNFTNNLSEFLEQNF